MRIVKLLCCFFFLTMLASCDMDALVKSMTPPAEEELAKTYIGLLRERKFDLIERDLDDSIKTPNIRETFARMASAVPAGEPTSMKLVGFQRFTQAGLRASFTNYNVTFEYQFGDKWMLINVATRDENGRRSIVGFNVTPLRDSLENLNRFTFSGKTPLHYAVLVAACIVPIFIIVTLVVCIRTPVAKRRWMWIMFILAGLGKFSLNWTTGQWSFQPVSLQLLGAGFFAAAYGPLMISTSLPVGAIVFLIRRATLMRPADAAESSAVKD